jgi:hypothetical protein
MDKGDLILIMSVNPGFGGQNLFRKCQIACEARQQLRVGTDITKQRPGRAAWKQNNIAAIEAGAVH